MNKANYHQFEGSRKDGTLQNPVQKKAMDR